MAINLFYWIDGIYSGVPNSTFSFVEIYQADNGKLGESDSSPLLDADAEVAGDECFSTEMPDTCWAVPQIPSPPTASGLHCPTKTIQNPFDAALLDSDATYFPGFKRSRHV